MKVIDPYEVLPYIRQTQRASTATYFDKNRVLRQVAVNPAYTVGEDGVSPQTGLRDSYDVGSGFYEGLLIEPARTNVILNNQSITNAVQSRTIGSGQWTLSFYGTGSIKIESPGNTTTFTLLGSASTSPTFTVDAAVSAGAAACPVFRVKQTFTMTGTGTAVITVTGTVRFAQLEQGTFPTSIIVTAGSIVTRPADEIAADGIILGTTANFLEKLGDAYLFPSAVYYDTDTGDFSSYTRFLSGSTYSIGNKVVHNACKYTALANGILPEPTPLSSSASWTYNGIDNGSLAYVRNTLTSTTSMDYNYSSPFETEPYHVTAFRTEIGVSSLGLHNIKSAKKVQVTIDDQNGNRYLYEYGVNESDIYIEFPNIGLINPQYIVTIRLQTLYPAKTCSIGEIVLGTVVDIGQSQYGMSTSITDYSKKTTDDFGNTSFVKRAFSKKLSGRVLLDITKYNEVTQLLFDLRASPTTWIATDDLSYSKGAIIYGYYKDFSMDISYPTMCACSLEIEGLA